MKTTLNLNTLKAVSLAAPTAKQTRFLYLCGVAVECLDKRVIYTATTGHILLCAQEDFPESDEPVLRTLIIIPLDVIKSAKLPKNRDNTTVTLRELVDGRFELVECEIVFKAVDGTFPNWRRVVPGVPVPMQAYNPVAHFNAHLLATMATFAERMGWPALAARVNYTADCDAPVAVTFGEGRAAFGVVMPASTASKPENEWRGLPPWAI